MLDVGAILELVFEDASDLDLVTWPRSVDQIVQDEDVLLPGDTSRRYGARGLLHRPFLIIAVDRPILFQVEWATALAGDARTENLGGVVAKVVEDRAHFKVALDAAVVRLDELGEHRGSLGDDTGNLDK